MRARDPDREGYAESAGVRIFWEEHGRGTHTILCVPPWSIVHSRLFKMQVPYLARYFRVITYDPRGNGRSTRVTTGHDLDQGAADALAVLDATGTSRASLLCKSRSAWTGVLLAAQHAERVERLVLIGAGLDEAPRGGARFHERRPRHDGWERFNAHYWREHYADFLEFFFAEAAPEPHSTKIREDCVQWGLATTPEILIATIDEYRCRTPLADLLVAVRVPTLLIHGYRRFVPDLYALLAACDLAIVQGGLSTCMELTAAKRPFLYVPLRNHFEQNFHVRHRLAQYGAGTRMDYAQTDPDALASAVADGLKRPVVYRDVDAEGARRAAALLGSFLPGGVRP